MDERSVTAEVRRQALERFGTCAVEVKLSKTDMLPFAALQKHQKDALFHVKHGGISFKIPDAGFQNPFDLFCMKEEAAFVCVCFYTPRLVIDMCFIDIDVWIQEQNVSARRSLTRARAIQLGIK